MTYCIIGSRAGTKIYQYLRKYNQQENFWKANFDAFRYLQTCTSFGHSPVKVETWRQKDGANKLTPGKPSS